MVAMTFETVNGVTFPGLDDEASFVLSSMDWRVSYIYNDFTVHIYRLLETSSRPIKIYT